jgi:hypothetical protein
MAANPKYYHPLGIDRTLDVSFIGGAYAKRPYYIYNLLENGIDVHAYMDQDGERLSDWRI